MNHKRLKLIAIHGNGSTYYRTLEQILSLFVFRSTWKNGVFYIERKDGGLVHNILFNPPESRFTQSIQMVVISRLMKSSFEPPADNFNINQAYQIKESRILQEFSHFGLPQNPVDRYKRAEQIFREAETQLLKLQEKIEHLKTILHKQSGEILREEIAEDIIELEYPLLLPLLQQLRSMSESGGDLDTISSAAFYALWLQKKAKAEGSELLYGRDYRFVFINYHDSLTFLEEFAPADLLIADVPIAALPTFEQDVRYLREKGVFIERFEDHHPYTDEHKFMFDRLLKDNFIGFYEMGGPLQGNEQTTENLRCGADIVYDNLIAVDSAAKSEGATALKQWTHATDLALKKTEMGELLTTLIKGGLCKIDLVQTIIKCIEENNFNTVFKRRGWKELAKDWDDQFDEIKDQLRENCIMISFKKKDFNDLTGRDYTNVLMTLAIKPNREHAKITVNKAVAFLARSYPEADYIFYCYGENLMVSRRVNQSDLSLNLGQLMAHIGNSEDGGHSGAAVCKPTSNPEYPDRLLKRVTKSNFSKFCKYISMRMNKLGYIRIKFINCSITNGTEHFRRGNRRLTMIIISTALLGLILVLVSKQFRPPAVLYSNRNFYPVLETDKEAEIIEKYIQSMESAK